MSNTKKQRPSPKQAYNAKSARSAKSAESSLFVEDPQLATSLASRKDVYENLPEILKTPCSLLPESHERDVFLVASLPVIAAHFPNVVAEHSDGDYSPDIFTLIIASPGAGKSKAGKAKKLGSALNQYLKKESLIKSTDDDLDEEQSKISPNSLFIPANTSSRAFYDSLRANGGKGLLFETEIDSMLNASSQEWGNFSDIVRKAYHHEAISINRKKVKFRIDKPSISICLTGTFDQFKRMFTSAENGHFSRYAFYTFSAPPKWRTHRPTKKSKKLDDLIVTLSHNLLQGYIRLSKRCKPLKIKLTDEHWDKIDNIFSHKMKMIETSDLSEYLHASNKRAAINALRIVSIFTILRVIEQDPEKLRSLKSISPQEVDLESSIRLAEMFLEHAIILYDLLPSSEIVEPPKGLRYDHLYNNLPEEFTTSEALEIAEKLGIPPRTVKEWLSKDKVYKRIKHGLYKKE